MATKITKEITIDLLTNSSVSIVTKRFITISGTKQQIGNTERKAYSNSPLGRKMLIDEVGKPFINSIFAIWGKPTSLDRFLFTIAHITPVM